MYSGFYFYTLFENHPLVFSPIFFYFFDIDLSGNTV